MQENITWQLAVRPRLTLTIRNESFDLESQFVSSIFSGQIQEDVMHCVYFGVKFY